MKTWMEIFKDHAFLISQVVLWQFFILILFFGIRHSDMADQAKIVVLQTYAAMVIAVVSFWTGVKVGQSRDSAIEEKK